MVSGSLGDFAAREVPKDLQCRDVLADSKLGTAPQGDGSVPKSAIAASCSQIRGNKALSDNNWLLTICESVLP